MSFSIVGIRISRLAPLLALTVIAAPAAAFDLSLEATLEHRHFPVEPLHDGQHEGYASLAVEPEIYRDWDRRDQSFTLRLFGRLDQYDGKRSHADVREAFYRYTARDFEWRLGVRQVFWGVLESAHLVDVINQTDFVEDIDGEDKLGQPMANFAWFSPIGTIDFYLMPMFRERTFPGEEGRPRPLLPVDTVAARTGVDRTDFAVRYFESFGRLDAGISLFHGTNREPRFDTIFDACDISISVRILPRPITLPCERIRQFGNTSPPRLPLPVVEEIRVAVDNARFAPVYDRVDQAGIDLQYVRGSLSLKAEAIHRRAHDYYFTAAGAGLEYTVYGPFNSDYDLTLFAEYLYDGRGLLDRRVAGAADQLSREGEISFGSIGEASAFQGGVEETQNAAALQNDLFLGTRLAFNDLAGSEILLGASRDLETGAVFGTFEASRRLFGVYRVQLSGRLFSRIPVTDPLYGYRDDDYLELSITRFF